VPGREGRTPRAVVEDTTVAGTPRILSLHNELPEVGVAEIEYPDGSVYKYEFDGGNVPMLRQKARHEPGLAANIIKKIAYETRKTKEGTRVEPEDEPAPFHGRKVVRQLPKDWKYPPEPGYEQTRLFPESMTFEDMVNEAVRIAGPTEPVVDPRQMRLFHEGDPLEGWYKGTVFTDYGSWEVFDNEDDFESAVSQVGSAVEDTEIEMQRYTAEWTHPEIGGWVGLDEIYESVADAERAAQEAAYEWISERTSELELEREEAEGDEEALAEIDDDPDEDDIEVRTDIAETDVYVSGRVVFYSEEFDDEVAAFDVYAGGGDPYLASIDNEDWLLAMQQSGYDIQVGSYEGMPERRPHVHVTEAVRIQGPTEPPVDLDQMHLFASQPMTWEALVGIGIAQDSLTTVDIQIDWRHSVEFLDQTDGTQLRFLNLGYSKNLDIPKAHVSWYLDNRASDWSKEAFMRKLEPWTKLGFVPTHVRYQDSPLVRWQADIDLAATIHDTPQIVPSPQIATGTTTEAVQVLGPSLPSEDPRQSTLFATKLDASLETIVDHLLQAGFKSHQMTAEDGVTDEDWIPVSPGVFRYVNADEDDDPNGWLDGPYGRGGIFLDVGDVGEEGVKFIANLGASSWTPDCPEQKDAELAVRALRRAGYEVNERPSTRRIPSYLASPPTGRQAESLQSFEDMVAFLRLQESKNPAGKQILLLEDGPIRVQTVNRHLDTFGTPPEHVYQIVAISPDVQSGVDDTVVGILDYTYLPSDETIHINMIEVMEEYRRQGIGTKMIQALKQEWPDQKINWGMLVGHGAEFKRSLGEDQQTHEYACVMGDIPDVKMPLDSMREQIDPKDLVDEDPGDPHVTILYGFNDSQLPEVKKLLADELPILGKLAKIDVFENEEHDVIIFDIESEGLEALNKKLAKLPHESTHPDYKPHMTIAYVKSGEGKKYKNSDTSNFWRWVGSGDNLRGPEEHKSKPTLLGKHFTIDRIILSKQAGGEEIVRLRSQMVKDLKQPIIDAIKKANEGYEAHYKPAIYINPISGAAFIETGDWENEDAGYAPGKDLYSAIKAVKGIKSVDGASEVGPPDKEGPWEQVKIDKIKGYHSDEIKENLGGVEGWLNTRTDWFKEADGGSHDSVARSIAGVDDAIEARRYMFANGWVRVAQGGIELDPQTANLRSVKHFVDVMNATEVWLDFVREGSTRLGSVKLDREEMLDLPSWGRALMGHRVDQHINPSLGKLLGEAQESMGQQFADAMEDMIGEGHVHFIGPFALVDDPLGDTATTLELSFHPEGWGDIPLMNLGFIGVAPENRGKGYASRVMRLLTSVADKKGWRMGLDVQPTKMRGDRRVPMTKQKLTAWYKRFGFKPGKYGNMVRNPVGYSVPTEPKPNAGVRTTVRDPEAESHTEE